MNQHYHTPLEDLLTKYLLQEANPEERLAVDRWLAADPANQHYYDQLRLVWEKSLQPALPYVTGEEDKAWDNLREKLHQPARRPASIRHLRWTAAAAAAAAVILLFWWRSTPKPWQQTVAYDAVRIDTLTDGSIVTLNKHSSLSHPPVFDSKERTVTMNGEAFFKIAPDKDRPFRIKTNGITITVLGTSFNIDSRGTKTAILVETGLVEIKNRQRTIRVSAGETITLGENDPAPEKKAAVPALYSYYRSRDFVCHDTPLGDLVDALNQSYGDSILIGRSDLRRLPITTTFHDESLHTILDVIGATLKIHIQDSASYYLLK